MHTSPHPPAMAPATLQGGLPERERSNNGSARAADTVARLGNNRLLTTDELAAELGMSAQSIRKRYSQTGSYFDLRPVKLPNRRLLWPADALEQLING